MKKRYVIKATGIFSRGYVRLVWFKKSNEKQAESMEESLKQATKFRFKWLANFFCNSGNKYGDLLGKYEVIEIDNKKDEICFLVDEIRSNLYGIIDYCNLSEPQKIDYQKKEYPIDIIEIWAQQASDQLDQLEKRIRQQNT